MIQRVGGRANQIAVPISEASFPAPFDSGLEYSAPARGTWNIVHVGMLLPEAHLIFVCAQGCLRGVVLTAAEMGASERFSTVAVREENVMYGDMEDLIIDGVTDIIEKLPKRPPAVLVYTSCVHHFMGSDLDLVFRTLGERYPDIHFTDCYMDPIMRKSGLNPDQTMRRQLYSQLMPAEINPKSVSIAGNDFPLDHTSELYQLLDQNGYKVREVTTCCTYEEYRQMAESRVCITTFPAAGPAGDMLEKKLGQKHLYLPFSFDYEEIIRNLTLLCDELEIELPAYTQRIEDCEKALDELQEVLGTAPVAIDYTAFPRPLGLARLLLIHGVNVAKVYADSFTGEEMADFEYLQQNFPKLDLLPTIHPAMRTEARKSDGKTLAIGQKAAYFTGTDYFVNVVEGEGFYGFDGILRLVRLIREAYAKPKDTRKLIQIKGWGCGC